MQFHPNDLSDLDELTEEHLGFSALSDGLGFSTGKRGPHPATRRTTEPASHDSSPESSNAPTAAEIAEMEAAAETARMKSLSGIGAVAAGPARPAPMFAQRVATVPAKPKPTGSQVLAEPAAARYLRVSAFFLDAFFVAFPFALAWLISFGADSASIFRQDPRSPLLLFSLILAGYFLLSESFGGQSLGKMLLGLRVVEDDKYEKPTGLRHAVIRLFLFVGGAACLGLGLFASFWDAKRRPWHDRYSGSIVRRKA